MNVARQEGNERIHSGANQPAKADRGRTMPMMSSRGQTGNRGLFTRLGYELGSLATDAKDAWRAGRRPWMAAVMCVLAAACALADEFAAARPTLAHLGDVYASLPILGELARLPLSTFLPTADLPLWGAILQTAIVIGFAEILLGRAATLCVAAAGQLVSTMTSRYLIALGTTALIGLPLSQAGVLDTGPSGMSTAVGGWLLARRGAYVSLAFLVVAIGAATVLQPNLDGREHAAALAAGLGAAVVTAPATRVLPGRAAHGLLQGIRGMDPARLTRLLYPLHTFSVQPLWAAQAAETGAGNCGNPSADMSAARNSTAVDSNPESSTRAEARLAPASASATQSAPRPGPSS